MTVPLQGVTHACFALSYLLALAAELARLRWPRAGLRPAGLALGVAGLVAHTAFLAYHRPNPAAPYGSLLLVAWVLAVFYLYGTVHHKRRAWAVFVLPLVLALVGLSLVLFDPSADGVGGDRLTGAVHGLLLVSAAVGICVGFVASVMYLVQARRLKRKAPPLGGMNILSLERLEGMNRRAVTVAFPLLTAGMLMGAMLLRRDHDPVENWLSLKVVGTAGLWVVFLVLMYLRYAAHLSGRRLAGLTILAFVLMVGVLAATHPFAEGAK